MATVANTPRSNTFTLASAGTGPFLTGFRIFEDDAISVYVNGIISTDWVMGATFLDGYDDNTSITFGDALGIGDVVVVDGNQPAYRDYDYLNGDAGLTRKVNIELARLWASVSELALKVGRSVRVFDSIDPIIKEAGKTIIFTASGIELGPTADEISNAQSYALTAQGAAALYAAAQASTYGILSTNTAAQNETAFALVPRGQRIDLKNETVLVEALPTGCLPYNGTLKIGSTLYPMLRDGYQTPFDGLPVIVKQYDTETVWPAGLMFRADQDRMAAFVVVSPSHGEDPPLGRLELGFSDGAGKFTGWHTVWTDDQAPLYNGAAVAQLSTGGWIAVCGEYDGADRKPIMLKSTAWAAPVRTDLEAAGITSRPFAFGKLMRWPAEFGGDDALGLCVATYAGTTSSVRILATDDEGTTWTEVTVGGAVAGFTPNEGALVIVPGIGSVVFARGQDGENMHYSWNTGDLLAGSWSAWEDSGIEMGDNVPHGMYHGGMVCLGIVDRELWSDIDGAATPAENILRSYMFDPADVIGVTGTLPETYTVEIKGENRFVGYFQDAVDKRGVPWLLGKMGETVFSTSTDNERASLALITPVKLPVAASHLSRPMPRQLLDNPRFLHWPNGTSFSLATDGITAARWRYNPSGATPAGSINRVELTAAEARMVGSGQRYALLFDTTSDPDDYNGMSQQWRGEEGQAMALAFNDMAPATLVLSGFGPLPVGLQCNLTIDGLTGGTATAAVNTILTLPTVQNDGYWTIEAKVRFPRIPAGSAVGDATFAYMRIDNSTSATAWNALKLVRAELWDGDISGPRGFYDANEDAERCSRYGWFKGGGSGVAAVLLGDAQYRAGAVNAFETTVPLPRRLVADLVSITVSAAADFAIVKGGGASTTTACSTLVVTELTDNRETLMLHATTADPAPADGTKYNLRFNAADAKISYTTGY